MFSLCEDSFFLLSPNRDTGVLTEGGGGGIFLSLFRWHAMRRKQILEGIGKKDNSPLLPIAAYSKQIANSASSSLSLQSKLSSIASRNILNIGNKNQLSNNPFISSVNAATPIANITTTGVQNKILTHFLMPRTSLVMLEILRGWIQLRRDWSRQLVMGTYFIE